MNTVDPSVPPQTATASGEGAVAEPAAHPAIPPEARHSADPPPGVSERRRHPRVELEREVSFESEHNFFTGFTEDISEGGLFVATYRLEPIGTPVELTFSLPDGHIVHVTGKVRWLRDPRDESPGSPPGMGVQFDELLSEDRRAVHEFIAARNPLFYED